MGINRTLIPLKTADDFADTSDINDALAGVNESKEFAADLSSGNPQFGQGLTTAGNRSFQWVLTATTWIAILWDNTAAAFKLINQAGALQKLSIAAGTDPTHAVNMSQLTLAVPVGVMLEYYLPSLPDSTYIWGNGNVHNISDFPILGTAWGNTFGGDGVTTFGTPNRQECFAMGRKGMGSATSPGLVTQANGVIGHHFGEEFHVLTTAELPSFQVAYQAPQSPGGASGNSNDYWRNSLSTLLSDPVGSDQGHNNIPPSIEANFIIKAR